MNRYIKLSEVVKYSSKRIFSNRVSIDNFITTDNILPNKGGVVLATSLPPNGESMPSYSAKNILVGNIRPYLRKIWYAEKSGGCSADVLVFEVSEGYNPKFVYYSLLRDEFFVHMMKGSKGTKMPRGDKNQILDFLIPNLELDEQQKIASVLSSLDSKIELNNRINAELEAMAKTIYDYWFVQFDFPDADGRPYKSSGGKMVWNDELKRDVPEGWELGTFGTVAEIVGGSTPSTIVKHNFCNEGIPWITPKDLALNEGNKFITKGEIDVSELGLKSASLTIMPKGTVLMSSRAPIGYLAISRGNVTTNQGFKSFVAKEGYSSIFLYYLVKTHIPTFIKRGTGSTFKEISKSILGDVKVCIPEKTIIQEFSEKLRPMFDRQNNLEIENHKLSHLRDWLLPMLMNGQVRVG